MASSRIVSPQRQQPKIDYRRFASFAGGGVAVLVLLMLVWSWLPPPPLGGDEEVGKTVDALFTALISRNPTWMDDCEQRLHTLRDETRLPLKSAKFLDGVIAQARDGNWEPAAKRLYDFIIRQRAPS